MLGGCLGSEWGRAGSSPQGGQAATPQPGGRSLTPPELHGMARCCYFGGRTRKKGQLEGFLVLVGKINALPLHQHPAGEGALSAAADGALLSPPWGK